MKVEFSFGQAEAVLAALHGIAGHKRVAFAGRLKFLQKNGLPIGERPGRGKAGAYSFSQLVQIAIAVELLQAGQTPQRASRMVAKNWSVIRDSIFYGVLAGSASVPESDSDKAPGWGWVFQPDGLGDLGDRMEIEVERSDDIQAIRLNELSSAMTVMGASTIIERAARRRLLVINGTALVRLLLHGVTTGLRFAALDDVLDDLLEEQSAAEGRPIDGQPWSVERVRKMAEFRDWADAKGRAAAFFEHVSAETAELIEKLDPANLRRTFEENPQAMIELIRWSVIDADQDGLHLTEQGEAVLRAAPERKGGK